MGIILDRVRVEARLPRANSSESISCSTASKIVGPCAWSIGTLQFACKVVVPGRTFQQRAINLTRGVPSRFHNMRLNKKFFKDLAKWKFFCPNGMGAPFFYDLGRV